MFSERFNETIFDALPNYLLNICEVCGSSQCPYCSIYNASPTTKATFGLIFVAIFAALSSNFRTRLLGGMLALGVMIT
jgi:hypothetical protein